MTLFWIRVQPIPLWLHHWCQTQIAGVTVPSRWEMGTGRTVKERNPWMCAWAILLFLHQFKGCPLYRGLDTLTNWNPTHTIAQHAGWLTRSRATQQLTTILKQTEVLKMICRGLVPTAVYTLLRTHAEDPQATAAHMQRTAIAKTAELFTYRTHKYLQHAATLPQTDQAHLLKLLFYQP